MKKVFALLLALLLLVSAVPLRAAAATVSAEEAVTALETMGLVQGSDNGFEGERAPTRYESLVMLIRLLGLDASARPYAGAMPFTDVDDWARGYVSYAYSNGLAEGVSASSFSGRTAAGPRDCVTFVLRALGYDDRAGDFSWESALAFSDSVGLTHGEYTASSRFLRNDLAQLCYTALTLELNDSGEKLIEKLYREGAVSYASLVTTRLARFVNTGKRAYTSEEIYELASSAVFFVEVFATAQQLADDTPVSTSSGFFISDTGLAVLSYHGIDGARRARITTTDNEVYDVTGVVYYDYYRDIAVVRVSRTAHSGVYTAHFPYLDIGDSDAISNGSPIYTISNPIGLHDSFSGGYVSNKLRIVNDPDYPCIQISAPISQGSSGGPAINRHGEVVGVIYGMYNKGQNLNICVPINCLQKVDLTAAGQSLDAVCDRISALKSAATITSSELNVSLKVDEARTLTIESDYPGAFGLAYEVADKSVASCAWGNFNTSRTIPLTITGLAAGETTVTVRFHDVDESAAAEVVIHVTVR